jgi:hypothetical protein
MNYFLRIDNLPSIFDGIEFLIETTSIYMSFTTGETHACIKDTVKYKLMNKLINKHT